MIEIITKAKRIEKILARMIVAGYGPLPAEWAVRLYLARN